MGGASNLLEHHAGGRNPQPSSAAQAQQLLAASNHTSASTHYLAVAGKLSGTVALDVYSAYHSNHSREWVFPHAKHEKGHPTQ